MINRCQICGGNIYPNMYCGDVINQCPGHTFMTPFQIPSVFQPNPLTSVNTMKKLTKKELIEILKRIAWSTTIADEGCNWNIREEDLPNEIQVEVKQ